MKQLPQELQDIIFLYLDFSTLEKCREIQSEFVKSTTMYNNLEDAAKNDNLKNTKWLKDQGYPLKYTDLYYHDPKPPLSYFPPIDWSAHVELIRWINENGYNPSRPRFFEITPDGDFKPVKRSPMYNN